MLDKEIELKFMMEHYRAWWLVSTDYPSFEAALYTSPRLSVNGHDVVESTVTVMGMIYKIGISRAVLEALVRGDVEGVKREGDAFHASFGDGALTDGTYTHVGAFSPESGR